MPYFEKIHDAIVKEEALARATVVRAPDGLDAARFGAEMLVYIDGRTEGTLGSQTLDGLIRDETLALMARTGSKSYSYVYDGSTFAPAPATVTVAEHTGQQLVDVFVDVYPTPPKLIVFGAVHIAIPLVKFAKELGFRTVVVDGREKFVNRERFPEADDLIVAWPDEAAPQLKIDSNTYIVILTHDEKFDEPALEAVLPTSARYIGAIGSKTTTANRAQRLRDMGIPADQIARIHGPVGLQIGAKDPAEIAVSILAEIIAVKYGKA